ncbi:hypothetical protein AVEN_112165-1 [Araneus ventricosus]|uniref:Uncharacterized protein n=1 Tax=Araneus ventricosus TaxID=182803 RepID=A0A4Y2SBI3_ARAVE|nr:hypothetical protein AVEN_112165-1 [Araneus ventricosus]
MFGNTNGDISLHEADSELGKFPWESFESDHWEQVLPECYPDNFGFRNNVIPLPQKLIPPKGTIQILIAMKTTKRPGQTDSFAYYERGKSSSDFLRQTVSRNKQSNFHAGPVLTIIEEQVCDRPVLRNHQRRLSTFSSRLKGYSANGLKPDRLVWSSLFFDYTTKSGLMHSCRNELQARIM